MVKLICPFCGRNVEIQPTDSEGNLHDESYLDSIYSGVGYVLVHNEVEEVDCPIAHAEGEVLGRFIYDTIEDAIEMWDIKYENIRK